MKRILLALKVLVTDKVAVITGTSEDNYLCEFINITEEESQTLLSNIWKEV